jgi:hypothetical protein
MSKNSVIVLEYGCSGEQNLSTCANMNNHKWIQMHKESTLKSVYFIAVHLPALVYKLTITIGW